MKRLNDKYYRFQLNDKFNAASWALTGDAVYLNEFQWNNFIEGGQDDGDNFLSLVTKHPITFKNTCIIDEDDVE